MGVLSLMNGTSLKVRLLGRSDSYFKLRQKSTPQSKGTTNEIRAQCEQATEHKGNPFPFILRLPKRDRHSSQQPYSTSPPPSWPLSSGPRSLPTLSHSSSGSIITCRAGIRRCRVRLLQHEDKRGKPNYINT